ncbi:DUF4355 domain-containing protein [Enterovibrio paralichthyis]|uniref:DUF4355 domain-containing protein n=1 Tax=Enterovibrio paralichthyis TaxID=2853805 RepID=UPI001C446F91|nr:DUF4355 domain-containing protein [Enterovibrio paralichthyis]MBV7299467.1 DUF4355 domain-containing protein [Enterovibrio paralichthyis]
MKKTVVMSVALLSVSGCVNQFSSMPDKNVVSNPVKYTEKYASASEKGLINPLAFVGGRDDTDEYQKYRKSWCAIDGTGPTLLLAELSDICTSKGGVVRDDWCVNAEKDLPLFKMNIGNSTLGCSTGISTYAEVISPVLDEDNDAAWLEVSKLNGFKDEDELKAEQKAKVEREKALAIAEQEQQRLAAEQKRADVRKMLSVRGLRICQKGNLGTYVGFIEDFSKEKVKVHVANYGGDGWTVGNFRETTIWDYPSNWYVCE